MGSVRIRDVSVVGIVLLLSISGLPPTRTEAVEVDKPNVVLVLVDDLGANDLGCQGSTYYKTPHIDALAATGMRFTQAYAACAVCSPTRAAVQTGRHPARLGVTDWIRPRWQRGIRTPETNPTEYVGSPKNRLLCPPNPYWMELSEVTIAELLKERNYNTAYIGKWHLGDDAQYPTAQGYDVNLGGCDYGQPPSYFDPYSQKRKQFRMGIPTLPSRKEGEYLTDREADEACRLIRQWKDEPFFIQLAHYAVHTPIQAKQELVEKYAAVPKGRQQGSPRYAAMIESVDDSVGRVLETLNELGLTDRTIVIFTSDNGGLVPVTRNDPLRSGKGYVYEGGIRVPLIIRWPGVTEPGTTNNSPSISMDLLPTIIAGCGAKLPDRPIDGVDLRSALEGEHWASRPLFWHFPHYRHGPGHDPYSAIRVGDWKLIRFYDPTKLELYNLAEDPSEQNDLAEINLEKVSSLSATLEAQLTAVGAELPIPNPAYRGR